jgi:hypothetical protein
VIALTTTTTNAYKRAACRFFPIRIPASKHRGSTESSILLNAVNLLLPAWCFHPEQIWAGGGPQECGPFAIRYLGCFGANCSMGPRPGELSHSLMCHNSPGFRHRRLPALVQFALCSATRFDGRWAPGHGNPSTARQFGLPQNRQRRRARPPTVWPARLGTSACSAFRDRRSLLLRWATHSMPATFISKSNAWAAAHIKPCP